MATKKKAADTAAANEEQKKAADTAAAGTLPEALDQSFKDNTALKVAYVAGKNFFFDERLAKSQFDQYQTIQNPYAEADPEEDNGEAENQ